MVIILAILYQRVLYSTLASVLYISYLNKSIIMQKCITSKTVYDSLINELLIKLVFKK